MHSQKKKDTLRVTLTCTFNNTDLEDKVLSLHTFDFRVETSSASQITPRDPLRQRNPRRSVAEKVNIYEYFPFALLQAKG